MSNYLNQGGKIKVFPNGAICLMKELPAKIWGVDYNDDEGFFLVPMDDYSYAGKIYGKTTRTVERITKKYTLSQRNLGVLLSGVKGSGKSLTVKLLAQKITKEYNIPAVIVNKPFDSYGLAKFLHSIDNPCLMIFDEFDKNFTVQDNRTDNKSCRQHGLFDLLDGIYVGHKLFVFCANEVDKISHYMLHRPGRIHYHISYQSLDKEVVKEYLEDNIKNKDFIRNIMLLTDTIKNLTFDILRAIVDECNQFNEDVREFAKDLNIPIGQISGYFHTEYRADNGEIIHKGCKHFEPGEESSIYIQDSSLLVDPNSMRPDNDGDYKLHFQATCGYIASMSEDEMVLRSREASYVKLYLKRMNTVDAHKVFFDTIFGTDNNKSEMPAEVTDSTQLEDFEEEEFDEETEGIAVEVVETEDLA